VFVINQKKVDSSKFDEHKAMIGFNTADEAVAAYFGSFTDGFAGRVYESMEGPMSVDEFKASLPELEKTKPFRFGKESGEQDQAKAAPDAIRLSDVVVTVGDDGGQVSAEVAERENTEQLEFAKMLYDCIG
jgi:hypothetical protein